MAVRFGPARVLVQHFEGGPLGDHAQGALWVRGRVRFWGDATAASFGPAQVLIQHSGGGALGCRALGALWVPGAGAFLGKRHGSPLWARTGSYPAFQGRCPRIPRSGGPVGPGGGCVFGETPWQSALDPHGFFSSISGEVPQGAHAFGAPEASDTGACFRAHTMTLRFGPARVLIQHFGGGPLGGRVLGAPGVVGAGSFFRNTP